MLVVVAVFAAAGATTAYILGGNGRGPELPPSRAIATSSTTPAQAARSACVNEVSSADAVATALAASAKSWREHTTAQVKLDSGEYTREETLDQWAKSKARGPKDLRRYKQATKRARSTNRACETILPSAVDRTDLRDCMTRLDTLTGVKTTGKKVHEQWSRHQKMMANKEDMTAEPSGGNKYAHTWTRLVKDSRPALKKYDRAVDQLAEAPPCT